MTPAPPEPGTAGLDAGRVGGVRRTNLGLILRLLRDHGPRSRSRIAAETGLPKATVSALTAELVARGLVREGEALRSRSVGRPGLALELDGTRVCGIGVELSGSYLCALALDARGTQVFHAQEPLDVAGTGTEQTLDALADLIRRAVAASESLGIQPLSICLAAHGTVDPAAGRVLFAANLGWRDVAVAKRLRARLGRAAPELRVENDVRASSLAELAAASPGVSSLVLLTGDIGVATGIVVEGRLAPFPGEIGHAPLGDPGVRCACGRHGCWETAVGLNALLAAAAEPGDPVRDSGRPPEQRLAELRRRAEAGDPRTLAALTGVTARLCHGIALLADLLSPQLIVLGGYFSHLADWFAPAAQAALDARALLPGAREATQVAASRLGFTAAARGAAELALDALYTDPTRVAPPT